MGVAQYQVDAFTSEVFKGNPAAVMLLDKPLTDETLLSIAAENNLSETAFVLREGAGFNLRWFTPGIEVDLCGHATLASAHVLFTEGLVTGDSVEFYTASGVLTVKRLEVGYEMDFPIRIGTQCRVPVEVANRLNCEPVHCEHFGRSLMLVVAKQDVLNFSGSFFDLPGDGTVILTAEDGEGCDFVSRVFGYKSLGIDEDPVTGSVHCQLANYWAHKLGRAHLKARQASSRGGDIECIVVDDRVLLRGQAVTFLKAEVVSAGLL